MIRTSKAPIAFPLPWNKEHIFMIRAADPVERSEFEGELAAEGYERVFDFQVEEAFDQGLAVLLKDSPDDLGRLRDIIAAEKEDPALVPAEDRALLDESREVVGRHWPALKTLLGRAKKRGEMIPTLAFHRFCTGWQGEGLPAYSKTLDGGVSMEAMAAIDQLTIRVVGSRCYDLLFAAGKEGNSGRLSKSDESPPPSKDMPRKAGSSAKRSGRKTPSSSRRPGRSRSSTSGSSAGGSEPKA